jgi:predicted dehydrogenase
VGWKESKYRRSGDADWTVFGAGYNKIEAFKRQIENFAGAVRGEESLVVTPEDALASVQVIEAAYRSLARGGWEPITEPREELVG